VRIFSGRFRRNPIGMLLFIPKLFAQRRAILKSDVVVIDAYTPAVCLFKKPQDVNVVQMWHAADAIKKFSLQIAGKPAGQKAWVASLFRMHKNYDYILCPADATRPFFEEAFGYTKEHFVKLAQPSFDTLAEIAEERKSEGKTGKTGQEILARYPELIGKKIIVYAPTFRGKRGADAQSLVRAFAQSFAQNLANNAKKAEFALVLKLHPLDAKSFAGGNEAFVLQDRDFSTREWLSLADAVITDYSGVAIEAAVANVPSYYYLYDIEEYERERGLNIDLRDESVGKYACDDSSLANDFALNIKNDVEKGSYDYTALQAFCDKYFETTKSGNAQQLADFIVSL